jgi:hypothetical protein
MNEYFSSCQRFEVLLDATIFIWKKEKYHLITLPDVMRSKDRR